MSQKIRKMNSSISSLKRRNSNSNTMLLSFLQRMQLILAPSAYLVILLLLMMMMMMMMISCCTTITMAFQVPLTLSSPTITTRMGHQLQQQQQQQQRQQQRQRQAAAVALLQTTFVVRRHHTVVSSDLSSSSSLLSSSSLSALPNNNNSNNDDLILSTSSSSSSSSPPHPHVVDDNDFLNNNPAVVVNNNNNNDHRYSANEWYHNLCSLPRSTILYAIRGPILAIMTWSIMVSFVYNFFTKQQQAGYWNSLIASCMYIDSTPHSFLVSALGLLLVFRTNSAYQRFTEGRKIWEQILSVSRCISRLVLLYPKEIDIARRQRVLTLLAGFPYLLHQHIQPNIVLHEEMNHRSSSSSTCNNMPWNLFSNDTLLLQQIQNAANRPLWICDRLCQEFTNVIYTSNFTSRERLTLLSKVDQLSQCIGQCERIHQTAVPLNYARHSLRSLTLWLFTLPFCLVNDFGLIGLPIVMGLTSWLLFGIYQIGFTIEDPFQGSLRLSALCDAIYCDVMHGTDLMKRRMTAFK